MSVQLVFWLKICLLAKQYQCVSQKNHAVHCYIDYIRDNKYSGSHGSKPEAKKKEILFRGSLIRSYHIQFSLMPY